MRRLHEEDLPLRGSSVRVALANIRCATSHHESVALAQKAIAQAGVRKADIVCLPPTTSAVVRPDGTVLAWHPYGKEGLLVADIDTAAATGLLASRCRS